MKMFKRAKAAVIELTSPVVECRSHYGVSFHLRDVRQEAGLAFCGYEPLDDRSAVTKSELAQRLPMQHENFKYCTKCVEAFFAADLTAKV